MWHMGEIFYTSDRRVWRKWLSENFETEDEIWFVFPTKDSGEAAVSYNDAVEEALCFGWIDGRAGTLDETHGIRRFTPRRQGSSYSRPNIERLIWLEKQGMIHPRVRETVLPIINAPYVFPADIMEEIQKDSVVYENYCRFSPSYQRIRVAYIDAARNRPEEFQKRLNSFLCKTRENKLITGYGGIEKYYGYNSEPNNINGDHNHLISMEGTCPRRSKGLCRNGVRSQADDGNHECLR